MIDLAYRAYSHSYKIDPIIRTLLDLDVYKLLMQQVIWKRHRDLRVTFQVINRSKNVRLADIIPVEELREQLEHTRTISYTPNELIWLQGNTFYGKRGMFEPDYIDYLRSFRLPEYELDVVDGQFVLTFEAAWCESTMWETFALGIISELRHRHGLRTMSRFELDVMYSLAKTHLWGKLQMLRHYPDLNLTDFATRRRHSFLFQEWAVLAAREALGDGFTGTSNAYLAMKHGFEAKGTNAHERPMVAAALADTDEALIQSQFDVLREWADFYDGALKIVLPDTFGSTQFFRHAPEWVADWTGIRYDSKEPIAAGNEGIAFYERWGRDPKTKLNLFTDGLDVATIMQLHGTFHQNTKVGFGWGSLFGNDFRSYPQAAHWLAPISIICKPVSVNGRPTVKLSDNYAKRTGDPTALARYERVFGTDGMDNVPVMV
jgi:nicotinate phosphoribosyltransferase